jgi:Glycosyltransferase sugar-binding region containing DXD motif
MRAGRASIQCRQTAIVETVQQKMRTTTSNGPRKALVVPGQKVMDPSKRRERSDVLKRRSFLETSSLRSAQSSSWLALAVTISALALSFLYPRLADVRDAASFYNNSTGTLIIVSTTGSESDEVATKQRSVLERSTALSNYRHVRSVVFDPEQQRALVLENQCGIELYDELVSERQLSLATELFKYCALSFQSSDVMYVDVASPLLVRITDLLQFALPSQSMLVLDDPSSFPDSLHGSFLFLREKHLLIAREMTKLLTRTTVDALTANPLLIQRSLHRMVEDIVRQQQHVPAQKAAPLLPGSNGDQIYLLAASCRMNPLRRLVDIENDSKQRPIAKQDRPMDSESLFTCPKWNEFCCSVIDRVRKQVVMVSRQPTIPNFRMPLETAFAVKPYNPGAQFFDEEELPFIATVRETVFARRSDQQRETPNLYEIFFEKDKLPGLRCIRCLHLRKCERYEEYCQDYLKDVCGTPYQAKFVAKEVVVTPPVYRRDPNRLVPRIIHQTWFEALDPKRYPNMSRLVESWKRSGWEYKFYSDADAEKFLRTHFPIEVLEAYRSLIPGAFKADLFRYCALLIHGGVYADVDILLESSLDVVIEPDIGFMVPMDEPEGCVWQGFIAAAPGHPFLSHAIQTVVNQVRNKFTSIDIDATFCPKPNYKVLHTFDVLFTAGPCLLGSSINRILGRHGQHKFQPGDMLPTWELPTKPAESKDGKKNATKAAAASSSQSGVENARIPGRTVILKQNKEDMGAHRFTFVGKNMVVAATDLENSDDRKNWVKEPRYIEPLSQNVIEKGNAATEGGEHYSKAHARNGIYGIEGLYVNHELVDEDIRIVIDDSALRRDALGGRVKPQELATVEVQ